MSQELRTMSANGVNSQAMSRDQIELIKATICKGATDDELKLFVMTAERTGLDPFARQVFAVKRYDSKLGREVMAIQVSIDGFRLVSERSGKYAGQLGPFWTNDGKEWLEVWLDKTPPKAAKVGILRSDFKEPLWAVATWDQYVQTTKDGNPNAMWKRMGPLMLAKCAESLARRTAFPQELSGLYTADEMGQAENVAPISATRAGAEIDVEVVEGHHPPAVTNGWTIEAQEAFADGLNALYIVLKEGGKPEAYEDQAATWRKRMVTDPAERVLGGLETLVKKLHEAAAKKAMAETS